MQGCNQQGLSVTKARRGTRGIGCPVSCEAPCFCTSSKILFMNNWQHIKKWIAGIFVLTTTPTSDLAGVEVIATSFADPQDVKRYRQCRADGGTRGHCLGVGDNGVGCWGDDTTARVPMCALPREDWEHLGLSARGRKVLVKANGKSIVCELRDTMPRRANIRNGAGIDLNPEAVRQLGFKPPIRIHAVWAWLEN